MTTEEKLRALREEKKCLQTQLAQRDERIQHLETVVEHQNALLEQLQEQMKSFGATAVYLVQQQLVPLARAVEVMHDLLGVRMREETISDIIKRCAVQLEAVEQQIKEAEVIHQDETGLYVAGKRYWEHVTCTPTLTHYHVDPSRGQMALEAIGILPHFKGVSIHDGWASYWQYSCEHACCNVHLLRELTFLGEEQGAAWAAELKIFLLDMKEATHQA